MALDMGALKGQAMDAAAEAAEKAKAEAEAKARAAAMEQMPDIPAIGGGFGF